MGYSGESSSESSGEPSGGTGGSDEMSSSVLPYSIPRRRSSCSPKRVSVASSSTDHSTTNEMVLHSGVDVVEAAKEVAHDVQHGST
jgi:hypothetical protein